MCLSTGFDMIAIEKNETNRYITDVHQRGTNNIPGGNQSVLPSSVAGSSNSDGLHDKLSRAVSPLLE